jgi:hypothetical protein
MADAKHLPDAFLAAFREQMKERASRAHDWFKELTAQIPEPLDDYEAQERVAALALFLMEIAGDLKHWEQSLGALSEEKP